MTKEKAMKTVHWTSQDLERLPDNGKRYEIIGGELYMSKQPDWYHQFVANQVWEALQQWSRQTKAGVANVAAGVIFADDDEVAPDVVWISREKWMRALQPDGHLHAAPELVVEVLAPGAANTQRDRDIKLKLYSRRGVLEYWIVNWQARSVEVYRRGETILKHISTLYEDDVLQSPHLPGFRCQVSQIFADVS
jgi:Uma2 family endonuclease